MMKTAFGKYCSAITLSGKALKFLVLPVFSPSEFGVVGILGSREF